MVPKAVIAQKAAIAPREVVIAPRQPTAAALPAPATRAGATRRSGTYRREEQPMFSLHVARQVLPVRACRTPAWVAVAAVAAAQRLPAADAAVEVGLAVVAAEAAEVVADAPTSR
jgi:hypothetical protein